MWIGIVVHQFKIFVPEAKNIFHIGIYFHIGQRSRLTRKLQFHLFQVVQVDVGITEGVNEFTLLKSRHLGHHLQQQGVRGNIERHAQKYVGTPLVELQAQFTLCHIELEEGMTGWKVHVGDIGYVPRADNDAARIGIVLYGLYHLGYLIDVSTVVIGP